MKILAILLIAVFALVCAVPNPTDEKLIQSQFQAFMIKYEKSYKSSDEHNMRYRIFKDNLRRVAKLNQKSKGRNNFGVTKFSDLTPSEFSHLYLMPKRPTPIIPAEKVLKLNENVTLPSAWDWRVNGLVNGVSCVTAVYNQGQCGSCWAFSATEEIESMEFLQGNSGAAHPRHLSMQQIVDCDTQAYGCNGGWTYVAYEYVMSAGGQDSLSSYPYEAVNQNCQFSPSNIEAKVGNWNYITQSQNEQHIMNFVGTTGPASICVDASSWQFYQGGVLTTCGQSLDHCVQLVGYGTIQGTMAWIVRNSWGTSWGDNGYIYLEYGQNMCGMADVVTTVTTSSW